MNKFRICVLGGTGFVGRHLLCSLAREGHFLRVLTRHREDHHDLLVLPNLELVEANIHYVSDLTAHFKACDAVINLVGILNEGQEEENSFRTVHAELPKKIVEACQFNGIRRLLHMSALHADTQGASSYLRTKGAGEMAAMNAAGKNIRVTSFRPSVIFGPDDSFFNRFAQLLRLSPILPLACPEARFAPVYVGDVIKAFLQSLTDLRTIGKHYELCGPGQFSLQELVEYTARMMGVRRLVIGLGDGASRLQARLMEYAPGKPFTRDNYLSMQKDSVCRHDGFRELGIAVTSINSVVPTFLGNRNRIGLSSHRRKQARR